jgi:hypothetical protein
VYTQYPYPYGGQGPNQASETFAPHDEVFLFASVTFNNYGVENMPVAFTIYNPKNDVWVFREMSTNESGIACVSFRIPWLGTEVWDKCLVLATVYIAGVVCNDTVAFEVCPRLLGDLGGQVNNIVRFFFFDKKVDGTDLALFMQCYRHLAPAEAMYLADLGGGLLPQFFQYDGVVDGKDLALFIKCYRGLGP